MVGARRRKGFCSWAIASVDKCKFAKGMLDTVGKPV